MQTIHLDISNKGVVPCIQAKQNEVGRKFLAVITDNGVPYNIPNNSLLSVWYEGDTDAGNYSSIDEKSAFTIDGNKVAVELVAQMLLKPSNGELCLSVTHGDGGETNTWNIPYEVEYKPGAGSAVPTEYYTALTESGAAAAAAVGDAVSAANEAKSAAENAANLVEDQLRQYANAAAESASSAADSANDIAMSLSVLKQLLIPVGYIFTWNPVDDSSVDLSTADAVADHFGFGVWQKIEGRFLYGCDEWNPPNSYGGSEEHTMTISEMPSHSHNLCQVAQSIQPGTTYSRFASTGEYSGSGTVIENTGGGQPFSIMPPYLCVYIWQRIA